MLVATTAAVCYAGWVFISRYVESRRMQERQQRQRAAASQALPPDFSGTRVKILQFYAVPAALKPGARGRICYSVVNARSVRLEPAVEDVWPSLNRCFEVQPRATTRYKLTAEGGGGELVSESFVLKVEP